MKKFSLTTLLIIITLGFSSCTVEEDTILNESTGKLFENVTVKRDASGAYYLDMELNNGVDADIISNEKTNHKDVNLFRSNTDSKRAYNENLSLNGHDSFSVGVNNVVNNNKSTLTIYDDDIKFNRTSEDDHLASYSIADKGDGTYDLDFTVDNNITVDFVYNEDNEEYEIHLEEGDNTELDFTRTFVKEDDMDLKITFVNHFNRTASRSESSTSGKPKIRVGITE